MRRVNPWLALGLIFIVGMITGAALTMGLRPAPRPPGPTQMRSHWLDRLNEHLHLTADQQAKIEPILTNAGEQLKSIHEEEVGRLSHIFETTDAQIFPLLTPDQQEEFKKMSSEQQRDFSRHRHWGPHGEGAPPPGDHPPPRSDQ